MKRKSLTNTSASRLWQVILLLAIAVILPTVCLLWFMTQAVKNERLAVRQKLVDVYTKRAESDLPKYSDNYWGSVKDTLTDYVGRYEERIWLFPEEYITNHQEFAAFVVYDKQGNILYPIASTGRDEVVFSDTLQSAWILEYTEKRFGQAIKQYDNIAKISYIPHVVYECKMGIVRCLSKQEEISDAIDACYELAYPGKHIINEDTPAQIGRARLMLANLYSKANHENLFTELQRQFLNSKLPNDPDFTPLLQIPTETRVFILSKLIDMAKANSLEGKLETEIKNNRSILKSPDTNVAGNIFGQIGSTFGHNYNFSIFNHNITHTKHFSDDFAAGQRTMLI